MTLFPKLYKPDDPDLLIFLGTDNLPVFYSVHNRLGPAKDLADALQKATGRILYVQPDTSESGLVKRPSNMSTVLSPALAILEQLPILG